MGCLVRVWILSCSECSMCICCKGKFNLRFIWMSPNGLSAGEWGASVANECKPRHTHTYTTMPANLIKGINFKQSSRRFAECAKDDSNESVGYIAANLRLGEKEANSQEDTASYRGRKQQRASRSSLTRVRLINSSSQLVQSYFSLIIPLECTLFS